MLSGSRAAAIQFDERHALHPLAQLPHHNRHATCTRSVNWAAGAHLQVSSVAAGHEQHLRHLAQLDRVALACHGSQGERRKL